MNSSLSVIGVIGGTGKLGQALARRLSSAGYDVIVGSRSEEKARAAAAQLSAATGRMVMSGSNVFAAANAELVIVSVPYASQEEILGDIRDSVRGKLVVDTTVPLVPPKVMRVQLPAEGCAALRARGLLAPGTKVVSAFHNVAAHKLATDAPVDCDVLIFGDEKDERQRVVDLCRAAGLRGLHAGALANSAAAEALTSVLIFINRHYAVDGAGIRIHGLEECTR
ncbi:MAG: NADPH-dependent F420 reductase [Steroidobacteraceae bacterium]